MSQETAMGSIKRLLVLTVLATVVIVPFDTPVEAADGWKLKSRWFWPYSCLDMDVAQGAPNGAKVQLWTCNGWDNQKWLWGNVTGDGWAELRSGANGKCLDLDVAGAVGNGTKIQVWDCNGAPQQQWRAEEIGGAWRLRNRRFECLDADRSGQYHDGKRVQAWDCHVQGNQLWTAEW